MKGLWTLMETTFVLYILGHMLQRMKVRQYNFWSGDVIIFKISFKLKMWGLNYISLQTNGKISPFKCMVKAHYRVVGGTKGPCKNTLWCFKWIQTCMTVTEHQIESPCTKKEKELLNSFWENCLLYTKCWRTDLATPRHLVLKKAVAVFQWNQNSYILLIWYQGSYMLN